MPRPAFRFAPSPNGLLHLGHAYSAILNAELARRTGGRFLLRIEDIDPARCRPEYETAIYEDLAWLGLDWETPVRRQSEHLAAYRDALASLAARGLVYPAILSRREIDERVRAFETRGSPAPHDPDGSPLYPGEERTLSSQEREAILTSGRPFTWRLDMARAVAEAGPLAWRELGEGPGGERGTIAAQPEVWGDVILGRRDAPVSYHLAVVLDDAEQKITEVVRGQDLFHATAVHRLLQTLLGLSAPAYRHHRLLLDEHGRKLSKSTRATGLGELRGAGISPAEIRRRIGLDADPVLL
jgi:glutamyl-Q tRNA(Asp) synthetase